MLHLCTSRRFLKVILVWPGYWLFVVCLPAANAQVQTSSIIDSLQTQLRIHPRADTARVNRLNALSEAARGIPALQLKTAQQALQLAQQLHDRSGQAMAYLNLGQYAMTSNDYLKANAFTQQAKQIYGLLNNRLGQARALNRMAVIAFDRGLYPESINLVHQAQLLAEPSSDLALKAYINLLMGQNCYMLEDFVNASSYARVGLQLARQAHDLREQNRSYSLLASVSTGQRKLAEARHFYEAGLALSVKLGSEIDQATGEGNVASVCVRQNNYAEAFRYARRAKTHFIRSHVDSFLPWIDGVLSESFLRSGQLDSALIYGRQSLHGAIASDQRDIILTALLVLAETQAKRGDYRDAYRHQLRYSALRDSLKGEEAVRQTANMQYRFALEKKQSQITLLTKNQKIEQQQRQYERSLLYASAIGVLMLLALAGVLFRNMRVKQRVNLLLAEQKKMVETSLNGQLAIQHQQLLETQLKAQQEELRVTQAQLRLQLEKERIARDLHDHVGAQLSVIAANAHTPAGASVDAFPIIEYAREAIQSLRDTVWAIDQPSVNVANFRSKLQQYLNRQQQLHPACQYSLTVDAPSDQELTSAQALNLFRQVQEAVHNAFKYAQASRVTVVYQAAGGQSILSVRDNGVGFVVDSLPADRAHYGLRNIERRAAELSGTAHIESVPGQGTCITVTIPLQG